MPGPFAITAPTNSTRLNDKRQAQSSFTVFNNSGRRIRGRAMIVHDNTFPDKWLTLEGEAERDFPIAGTQQYNVQIVVPPDAPPGNYQFRLDEVGTENPDEELTQGPTITFEVPAPVPPNHKPFPIWIILVIIGVVLIVGGVIVAIVISNNNSNNRNSANATATAVAHATETAQANSTATAIAGFSFDFIAGANTATWRGGPPLVTLPFNGSDVDPRGFVIWRNNFLLNNGTRVPRLLETHPAWVTFGTINGCYTNVYSGGEVVRPADRISGSVGFISGGGVGAVTFRISLQAQGLTEEDVVNIPLSYADGVRRFSQPLGARYQGRAVNVCLHVDAGASAAQDWASWIDVKIAR